MVVYGVARNYMFCGCVTVTSTILHKRRSKVCSTSCAQSLSDAVRKRRTNGTSIYRNRARHKWRCGSVILFTWPVMCSIQATHGAYGRNFCLRKQVFHRSWVKTREIVLHVVTRPIRLVFSITYVNRRSVPTADVGTGCWSVWHIPETLRCASAAYLVSSLYLIRYIGRFQ